jgi:hypothetical protein
MESAIPPRNTFEVLKGPTFSQFVAAENVILFAGGTFCAFQAADEKNRHTHSDQDGHDIRMGCEPVDYAMHKACLPDSYGPFGFAHEPKGFGGRRPPAAQVYHRQSAEVPYIPLAS